MQATTAAHYIKRKQTTLRIRKQATKHMDIIVKAALAAALVVLLCINC